MCAWLCVHEYVIPLVFMPQRYPRWHEITESAVCMFLPATDSSCQSVSLAYCHLVSFSLSLSLSLSPSICVAAGRGCRVFFFFFFFFSAVLVLWVEVKHWRKKRKKNAHTPAVDYNAATMTMISLFYGARCCRPHACLPVHCVEWTWFYFNCFNWLSPAVFAEQLF